MTLVMEKKWAKQFKQVQSYPATANAAEWLRRNVDIHNVWTVVEIRQGNKKIDKVIPGIHIVNRVGYLVSFESWSFKDEGLEWER